MALEMPQVGKVEILGQYQGLIISRKFIEKKKWLYEFVIFHTSFGLQITTNVIMEEKEYLDFIGNLHVKAMIVRGA